MDDCLRFPRYPTPPGDSDRTGRIAGRVTVGILAALVVIGSIGVLSGAGLLAIAVLAAGSLARVYQEQRRRPRCRPDRRHRLGSTGCRTLRLGSTGAPTAPPGPAIQTRDLLPAAGQRGATGHRGTSGFRPGRQVARVDRLAANIAPTNCPPPLTNLGESRELIDMFSESKTRSNSMNGHPCGVDHC